MHRDEAVGHLQRAVAFDPDYSAAYVVLRTSADDGIEGHGLTFTSGRGTEVCVAAIHALEPFVVGESEDRDGDDEDVDESGLA